MIVVTEKVLREADGSVKLVVVRPHTDGKVFAPGCASKPDGESREEPEEHKRNSFQQSLGETLQFGSSKPTQSPKPIEDRTEKPVTQEIVGKLQEELSSSDRPGETRDKGRTTCPKKSRSNGAT